MRLLSIPETSCGNKPALGPGFILVFFGTERRVQKPLLQPDLDEDLRSPVTRTIQQRGANERCVSADLAGYRPPPPPTRSLDACQVSSILHIIRRVTTLYNYFITSRSTASGAVCRASVALVLIRVFLNWHTTQILLQLRFAHKINYRSDACTALLQLSATILFMESYSIVS